MAAARSLDRCGAWEGHWRLLVFQSPGETRACTCKEVAVSGKARAGARMGRVSLSSVPARTLRAHQGGKGSGGCPLRAWTSHKCEGVVLAGLPVGSSLRSGVQVSTGVGIAHGNWKLSCSVCLVGGAHEAQGGHDPQGQR